MQYFQWTIGSTTVRNPDRLREGLRVLKDFFEGRNWNLIEQEKFFDLLKDKSIYEIKEENYGRMTKARKQEHARKWVSVLNQLGFCYAYESSDKPVLITEAGESLLNNPELEDEIFLRQLLKFQKPCALPKQSGKSFRNVNILPFILSLKITYELEGLSKEEISIFLNTTIRMNEIEHVINQIKSYRDKKSRIGGSVKKKEFYVQTQQERLKEIFSDEIDSRLKLIKSLSDRFKNDNSFISTDRAKGLLNDITKGGKGSNTVKSKASQSLIVEALKVGKDFSDLSDIFLNYFLSLKISTLKDYADLTVRYLRKSGLFSVSRDKLITVSDKESLIKALLAVKWDFIKDEEYLDYLWSSTLPKLPSDELVYLSKYLNELISREKSLFDRISKRNDFKLVLPPRIVPSDLISLKQQVREVEQNLLKLKEISFYYSQGEENQILDILNFYSLIIKKEILGGEAYYPAYFEWNTWRVFLAIDTLLNKPYEARNFNIDSELQPIHHAPGNKADMLFEYREFLLVAEVTLMVGPNQWSAEAEPVPRHIAKIQFENRSKEVFGLFVAPKIDPNTVLTFFNNRKHSIEGKMIELTIIPFTIEDLKFLLSTFQLRRFSIDNMKELLTKIRDEIDESEDALEWFKKIPNVLENWANYL